MWYNLYNLKNVKNTHGGVLLLVKFTKSKTPPWMLLTFFKLRKWCQIAQSITDIDKMNGAINIEFYTIYFIFPYPQTERY